MVISWERLGRREASEVLAVPEPSSRVPFAPPAVALSEVPGSFGFLSTCDGALRETLVLTQGSQLLSSCEGQCSIALKSLKGIWPHLALEGKSFKLGFLTASLGELK